ncbi:3-isopropylmalate dehydratase small subunit [Temperatibacter marinus]|uniref:3-isopropylmalate dehydratase small subunit n=1 Tax=Temperatibacter marinus TaxID=1456591 RepID=A0AA52H9M2_9PROT|nr:3-isopropylmalate dehydratase small subunit [Temperatibacter marinus]WND01835.1 3-isopropylmalate dehydratase small subunit [Temperatibacter marinus]
MKAFKTVTSIPTPFPRVNVDTDVIIQGQFLKTIKRTGLGVHAFNSIRYDREGNHIPDNIFDRVPYNSASILVAGDNFGCGSSREHAPWAIGDMGYRCVIAPSFADIFAGNCAKNGIVTVCLPQEQIDILVAEGQAEREITVDLEEKTVTIEGDKQFSFDYNAVHRHMLLNGLDEIGQTLQSDAAITAYENERRLVTPWLFSE